MDFENATAQMRKGILEFCILALIAKEEVYPSDIIQKLKDSKLIVVEGTLYPLLARLKSDGFLSHRWIESASGPPRKYYRLTKSGEATLLHLKKTWQELELAVNLVIKEDLKK